MAEGIQSRRCRACLNFFDANECVNLEQSFDCTTTNENMQDVVSSKTLTLLEVFNECTQLNVRLENDCRDEFLREDWETCRYLCNNCICELQQTYRFILKARLSHTKLCEWMDNEDYQIEKISDNELSFMESLEENFAVVEEDEERLEEESPRSSQSNLQVEQALAEIFGLDSSSANDLNSNNAPLDESRRSEMRGKTSNSSSDDRDLKVGEKREVCSVDNNSRKLIEDTVENTGNIEALALSKSTVEKNRRENFLIFKCELCMQKFDFQRDLMRHYEEEHDENDFHFSCNSCERRFFAKSALNTHIREMHQNCEYQDCQQCGRTVLKSFLKLHMQRHRKRKRFLCSECPNTFSSHYALRKHQHIHAKERDRNIECEQCQRKFFTLDAFRMHQITHQDPKERQKYGCSLCEKTFMRQTNLKLHMQMHRGETMNCSHCGKQFVRRKDLEIHIRFHTGEFPFACTLCDKRFAIKGHLTAHERKHRGVRYQCDQCEKQFLNTAGLRQHSYEHTSMPLYCDVCQKGFPTKFKVRRHIRSVHQSLLSETHLAEDIEKHIKRQLNERTKSAEESIVPAIIDNETCELEMLEEDVDELAEFLIQ